MSGPVPCDGSENGKNSSGWLGEQLDAQVLTGFIAHIIFRIIDLSVQVD